MLLIFPPVAKPGEPPAGIAQIAGCLRAHDLPCMLLDANIEGLLYLVEQKGRKPEDTWSMRAERNLERNLEAVRTPGIYANFDTYQRVVRELNRVVEQSSAGSGISMSLTNYQEAGRSASNSSDLLDAAAHYQDNPFFAYFSSRLKMLFAERPTPLIGFSLNYLSQAITTFAMIGFIRDLFPGTEIVVGGGLVTSWLSSLGPRRPFGDLVDHWIGGPGEEPLLQLLGSSLRKRSTPDYSGLPLSDYLAPGVILPYGTSSGCYWNKCSFCPEAAENNPFSQQSPEKILRDLAQLGQEHSPVLIHLLDNAVPPAVLDKLGTKPLPAPWYGFARVDTRLEDPDFCRRLRASGCIMLKLGIESGSQAVLDAMQKGISVERVSRVLTNLEQAGIDTYVYLLFGTPYESIDEARQTLEFTISHHSSITFLNLAVFNLPVRGKDTGIVTTKSFDQGDLSLYHDFIHPRGWDRKKIRLFLDREFKRHPAVAAILRRDPPLFTSNHAPFFSRGVRRVPRGGFHSI